MSSDAAMFADPFFLDSIRKAEKGELCSGCESEYNYSDIPSFDARSDAIGVASDCDEDCDTDCSYNKPDGTDNVRAGVLLANCSALLCSE
jgi:hypothetical protein